MSIDKVRAYFHTLGIEERILEFDVSSATVELAAQALGCEPCRIAKTLSFLVDGHPILIVTASDIAGILRNNAINSSNIDQWVKSLEGSRKHLEEYYKRLVKNNKANQMYSL